MKTLINFFHATKTQAILSLIIVVGVAILLKWGHLTEGINNRILDVVLVVVTFYFGGSKSSTAKDETIASLATNQQATATIANSESTVINKKGE